MQFLMIAYNFLKTRCFINSGTWSTKAIKAKLFGDVSEYIIKRQNFNYIPKDYSITDNPDYLHITTNNTIFEHSAINYQIVLALCLLI